MNKRIQKLHTAANTVKTAENSDFFETKFCTIKSQIRYRYSKMLTTILKIPLHRILIIKVMMATSKTQLPSNTQEQHD